MKNWLDILAGDPTVPGATIFSFVVQYDGQFDGAVFTSGVRYEIYFFRKADIHVANIHGAQLTYLNANTWKSPLDARVLYNSEYRTQTLDALNAAIGGNNDLELPNITLHPEYVGVPREFNECLDKPTYANANYTHNRPSTDFDDGGDSPDLLLPFSQGDSFHEWVGDDDEYYAVPGGYVLPHPTVPTAADIIELNKPEGERPNTTRLDDVRRATSGKIFFLGNVSDSYQRPPVPIVRSEPTSVVTIREPLLGFYGMSQFRPADIYQIRPDFPPYMQTFKYTFEQAETNNLIKHSDESVRVSLVPRGPLKLTLESYNTFDQAEKELETVSMPWPKILSFEKEFASTVDADLGVDPTTADFPVLTVNCETIHGKPDHVFVMLEHVYTRVGDYVGRNPTVETLKMSIFGEELSCVSRLDTDAMYHLTRRNSHIHASVAKNYELLGAAFLTKDDCMDFEQWKGLPGVDLFNLDVTCSGFTYDSTPSSETDSLGSKGLDLRMRVLFCYQNFGLNGKQHDSVFSYI